MSSPESSIVTDEQLSEKFYIGTPIESLLENAEARYYPEHLRRKKVIYGVPNEYKEYLNTLEWKKRYINYDMYGGYATLEMWTLTIGELVFYRPIETLPKLEFHTFFKCPHDPSVDCTKYIMFSYGELKQGV
jgi:hypothetical protein